MKTILITGCTGFVGGALAAKFLNNNYKVIALSRNDINGSRTKENVLYSINGLDLNPKYLCRLTVVDMDFANLADYVDDIQEVWHCAANMSYAPNKLHEATAFNVGFSQSLYEYCATKLKNCQRFYYMSTAYNLGNSSTKVIQEKIYSKPKFINSYQISKWMAEQTLYHNEKKHKLPLTILRPSVVVGSMDNNLSPRNHFGLYMYIKALKHFTFNCSELDVDLPINNYQNLIPIDYLLFVCQKIQNTQHKRASSEVFHLCTKQGNSTPELFRAIGECLNKKFTLRPAKSKESLELNHAVSLNKSFAAQSWKFSTSNLDKVLEGDELAKIPYEKLVAIIVNYNEQRDTLSKTA